MLCIARLTGASLKAVLCCRPKAVPLHTSLVAYPKQPRPSGPHMSSSKPWLIPTTPALQSSLHWPQICSQRMRACPLLPPRALCSSCWQTTPHLSASASRRPATLLRLCYRSHHMHTVLSSQSDVFLSRKRERLLRMRAERVPEYRHIGPVCSHVALQSHSSKTRTV